MTKTRACYGRPGLLIAATIWLLASICCEAERRLQNIQAKLYQYGSTIKDWEAYTHTLRSNVPCRDQPAGSRVPRIGYFTRHTGTLWDWMSVAEHLDLDWARRNPVSFFAGYGMSGSEADALWQSRGAEMCAPAFDAVVFCDTVVDARPVLQGSCGAPIVLQVTNRFDWKVKDTAAYLELMNRTAQNPRVWWVTNSPFEELYMSWQGFRLPPERHLMLRPVGAAILPAPAMPPEMSKLFAVVIKGNRRKHPDRDVLLPMLKRFGVDSLVHAYDRQYGGPTVLAQHRGVIHLPYQVSIMSLYETLAAGGLYIVPSPAFFRSLRQRHRFGQQFVPMFARVRPQKLNWTLYTEWYHPDFVDALIYFHDWAHLTQILQTPESDPMWVAKRAASQQTMMRIRTQSVEGWRRVMAAVSAAACG